MKLELRDIHLPESDMLWWPLATGWYFLLAILLLLIVAVVFWRKRTPKKPQVKANLAMHDVYLAYVKHEDQHQFMQDMSIMMRRVCLRYFPAEEVASLHGKAWLMWLDQSTDGQVCFSSGIGQSLESGPYNRQQDVEVKELHDLCRQWLDVIERKTC
ncbi:MAG: DUF4381 domain-containing protein [Mariprofundaceae bacterium]|nr:DUF4381 domain-containing protein [Mariprofundaceae bacterium]